MPDETRALLTGTPARRPPQRNRLFSLVVVAAAVTFGCGMLMCSPAEVQTSEKFDIFKNIFKRSVIEKKPYAPPSSYMYHKGHKAASKRPANGQKTGFMNNLVSGLWGSGPAPSPVSTGAEEDYEPEEEAPKAAESMKAKTAKFVSTGPGCHDTPMRGRVWDCEACPYALIPSLGLCTACMSDRVTVVDNDLDSSGFYGLIKPTAQWCPGYHAPVFAMVVEPVTSRPQGASVSLRGQLPLIAPLIPLEMEAPPASKLPSFFDAADFQEDHTNEATKLRSDIAARMKVAEAAMADGEKTAAISYSADMEARLEKAEELQSGDFADPNDNIESELGRDNSDPAGFASAIMPADVFTFSDVVDTPSGSKHSVVTGAVTVTLEQAAAEQAAAAKKMAEALAAQKAADQKAADDAVIERQVAAARQAHAAQQAASAWILSTAEAQKEKAKNAEEMAAANAQADKARADGDAMVAAAKAEAEKMTKLAIEKATAEAAAAKVQAAANVAAVNAAANAAVKKAQADADAHLAEQKAAYDAQLVQLRAEMEARAKAEKTITDSQAAEQVAKAAKSRVDAAAAQMNASWAKIATAASEVEHSRLVEAAKRNATQAAQGTGATRTAMQAEVDKAHADGAAMVVAAKAQADDAAKVLIAKAAADVAAVKSQADTVTTAQAGAMEAARVAMEKAEADGAIMVAAAKAEAAGTAKLATAKAVAVAVKAQADLGASNAQLVQLRAEMGARGLAESKLAQAHAAEQVAKAAKSRIDAAAAQMNASWAKIATAASEVEHSRLVEAAKRNGYTTGVLGSAPVAVPDVEKVQSVPSASSVANATTKSIVAASASSASAVVTPNDSIAEELRREGEEQESLQQAAQQATAEAEELRREGEEQESLQQSAQQATAEAEAEAEQAAAGREAAKQASKAATAAATGGAAVQKAAKVDEQEADEAADEAAEETVRVHDVVKVNDGLTNVTVGANISMPLQKTVVEKTGSKARSDRIALESKRKGIEASKNMQLNSRGLVKLAAAKIEQEQLTGITPVGHGGKDKYSFSASTGSHNDDECASGPCANGGGCAESGSDPSVASGTYVCKCVGGYTGKNCDAAAAVLKGSIGSGVVTVSDVEKDDVADAEKDDWSVVPDDWTVVPDEAPALAEVEKEDWTVVADSPDALADDDDDSPKTLSGTGKEEAG